jgi:two-component system, LytTR family, response regulator
VTRPLRVLLVDDEPLARRRLRRMLAAEAEVVVIGECGSGSEAARAIATDTPDVVLLDVQMPGGDGFEVMDQIGASALPLVVFVTAYDEYALRAIEAAALDYLLKPVRRARLRSALTRARDRLALYDAAATSHPVGDWTEAPASEARAERLLVDRGNHMDVIAVDDIDWIEAADNHVIVHARSEQHRFRRTMDQVLDRLPPESFVRVHRSAIVNLKRVRQVHEWFHGGYLLVLADGTKVPTGRAYRERVMQRLHVLR